MQRKINGLKGKVQQDLLYDVRGRRVHQTVELRMQGVAYMSCRIGYMYAAGKVSIGGCRIADTQSCRRGYMHIYAAGKVFIGGCAYTGV